MKTYIENRVREVASYILATRTIIRKTAKAFGVSKSTIEKDMNERLLQINPEIYAQVVDILKYNKSVRHVRGGQATKMLKERRKINANRN